MCLKKSSPNPLSLWASSINPGISAILITKSSINLIFPTIGLRVVNGYSAILGSALVTLANRVDFPALGNPTKPISARIFNSKRNYLSYPNYPG